MFSWVVSCDDCLANQALNPLHNHRTFREAMQCLNLSACCLLGWIRVLRDVPCVGAQHAREWRINLARTDHSAPGTAQRYRLNHNGYRSSKHAHQSTRNAHVFKQCCVTICLLVDFLGVVVLRMLFDVLHPKHTTHSTIVARFMKRCSASMCPHAVF